MSTLTRRNVLIGLASLALAVALSGVWVGEWIGTVVIGVFGPSPPMIFIDALRWVAAVVVGVALVWCGVRPWGRILVWVAGLLTLWVLPAMMSGAAASKPSSCKNARRSSSVTKL